MQISIFDIADEPFKFGEPVKVIDVDETMNAETYFYLQDLQNKKGLILKTIKQPKLQYEVDFNGKLAIVYHTELKNY